MIDYCLDLANRDVTDTEEGEDGLVTQFIATGSVLVDCWSVYRWKNSHANGQKSILCRRRRRSCAQTCDKNQLDCLIV